MRRRIYILSLWVATLGMLLSTVVMHHHHFERICMVMEECEQDGCLNDEHTEHHDNEQEGCQVHQMHHFVNNAKVVKSIQRHLLDQCRLVFTLYQGFPLHELVALSITRWQEVTTSLSLGCLPSCHRRGPPMLS